MLAVGSFVAIGYAIVTGDNPGPTPGDQTAARPGRGPADGLADDVAKVVTVFGSTVAVLIVTLITSIWLWLRGHWPELVVLLLGVAVLLLAPADPQGHRRPPAARRTGSSNAGSYSYPSGHATHAIVYAWIALTVALRLRPGMQRASALIAAGLLWPPRSG